MTSEQLAMYVQNTGKMSYEQAMQDGFAAFKYDRAPASANPFNAWSPLFTAWLQGWLAAKDGEVSPY